MGKKMATVFCSIELGALKQIVRVGDSDETWECHLEDLPALLGDIYAGGYDSFHLYGPMDMLVQVHADTLTYCRS